MFQSEAAQHESVAPASERFTFIPRRLDCKTRPTYAVGALDDLHVTEIGALAELGTTYLEVHGKVVMHQARRISDLANDEDELLDKVIFRVLIVKGAP